MVHFEMCDFCDNKNCASKRLVALQRCAPREVYVNITPTKLHAPRVSQRRRETRAGRAIV